MVGYYFLYFVILLVLFFVIMQKIDINSIKEQFNLSSNINNNIINVNRIIENFNKRIDTEKDRPRDLLELSQLNTL
tara:strand:+ start:265 stop:492 length:228 start_codon:yes stop_codon:yes gene_type:complete